VLFSGGQDSSISLAWALNRFTHVGTIGFNYAQRNSIELGARQAIRHAIKNSFPDWAPRLGNDTIIYAAGIRDLGQTALTHEAEIAIADDGFPTTFVPGRNLVFLSLAGGLAYRQNIGVLIAGMCETDYSGYPDCRAETLAAQMEALRLGTESDMVLQTPLMEMTKADSWRQAEKLGGAALVDLINEQSHTCYRGVRSKRYDWGYGCADCPACTLRARGWTDYRAGA